MEFNQFEPPERILMGPGPSNINPRVLNALSKPIIGHLDPEFIKMMDSLKDMLRIAFQTKNEFTLPLSGPGSIGMEFCFVNLIEAGDTVIVCQNGVFGGRMKENVERCGGKVILVQDSWGRPVDPNKIEETFQKHPHAKILAFVHAETSTGACSNVEELSKIAKKYNALTIVDTVTSLGGIPVKVDEWKIDAVYSGTQKCLSCVPGLSPVSLSPKALEKIKNRKSKVQSWFLDANLISGYWNEGSKRSYHHTAPINPLYALHEALVVLLEEGLENAWRRHLNNHKELKTRLESLGFSFLVEEKSRLPQLNAVKIPPPVDEALTRKRLLSEYGIEIGAGLGELSGKIWRIGLMGHSSNKKNIVLLLGALKEILS